MIRRGRLVDRLTYANVVATLALFIALGGASYAATVLPASSVGPTQLQIGAVHVGALGFPLGVASTIDRNVEEIANGACNGPWFPGQTAAPPCVPPVPSYSTPSDELRLSVRSAGRLEISAVAGLDDQGTAGASARVTVRVIVDRKVESEGRTEMSSGQVLQVPAQALVPVSAGAHTIGLAIAADYSARPENVLVAPVSIIATALPADPAHAGSIAGPRRR